MKQRVLVTGADGFIGRALVARLVKRDDLDVLALTRQIPSIRCPVQHTCRRVTLLFTPDGRKPYLACIHWYMWQPEFIFERIAQKSRLRSSFALMPRLR